ncbi:MAG: U32 family peptidase [Gammaproteobacteria bacterium]|nr:U32 family peptidase [Gammaproteobacteria bacterium]
MKNKIELLAPGGDIDAIKAAIVAGADAVYCGLDRFNARNRAENITIDDLPGIIRLAHQHDCEVFLTLNVIIVENELPALITLLNRLVNTRIDGIIVQDLGVCYLLAKYYPSLDIHASTQLTTHNAGQIKFLHKLAATRVNLSRELNLDEIAELSTVAHAHDMLTEVFVHGSNCIAFSGLCYMSSVHEGKSGNRGQCSQPCRDQYQTTAEGNDFPLNLKDNSAFSDLAGLYEAGVDSLKIEGRIKKYHYVHTVVDSWRKQLQHFYQQNRVAEGEGSLRKVFNRDFSNAFLKGEISRNMYIDNPRDNTAIYRAQMSGQTIEVALPTAKREVFEQKAEIVNDVEQQINQLSIEQAPLTLSVSGQAGTPLTLSVKTPDLFFEIHSQRMLVKAVSEAEGRKGAAQPIDRALLLERFKAINEGEYFIETIDTDRLDSDLMLPFRDFAPLKKQILYRLNGSKEYVSPVVLPRNKKQREQVKSPELSVLISSPEDVHLCAETSATVFYQLPNSYKKGDTKYEELFNNNKNLIPWFPSVLIGDDYLAAVTLLDKVKPKQIVTDNTGIAYEAYHRGIDWIAGPQLNLINSYSLLCLQEVFNCRGAFISNEISRGQMCKIARPDNFKIYYSIYHPIILMTSRACFFYQVTGCKKNIVDGVCIQRCEKSSSITSMNDVTMLIKKRRGDYHTIYNETNYLNTAVLSEVKNLVTDYFIDLRDVKTETQVEVDKAELTQLFQRTISGEAEAANDLEQVISSTTSTQYKKGI